MGTLITLQNGVKHYGAQTILNGASVELTDEHKIGLIGRNGAGKSTLCRILLGQEELDGGNLILASQLRLGYLRQHDPFLPGESALDFLIRDSGQPDWRCGQVAGQFNLKGRYLEGPVKELSGGWQTRVKLAALLLHDPNLLILDEPTNFLDLRTQLLLEAFLKDFQAGCLIVSHDRAFLQATCTHTLGLARGQLELYPGTVEAYLAYQADQKEHKERVNATIQTKAKQLERFINKNRANANTASQARSKQKQLDALLEQKHEIERDEATVVLRMPVVEPRKGPVLRCHELAIGYPDRTVAQDVRVELEHGQRVAVVGDNGQGKTTFIRTIAGSLDPVDGKYEWGYGVEIGAYAQHVYSTLPTQRTVHEYLIEKAAPEVTGQQILDLAGSFLFRGAQIEKPIGVLSGGERARLVLAGLLLSKYNVLILDEPGNHLDVETVDALCEALIRYQGTLIFTSHDRHFLKRMSTAVVEVRDGTVKNYPSSYDDYLYRVEREISEGLREVSGKPQEAPAKPKKAANQELSKEERKKLARRQFDLDRDLKSLERQLEKYGALRDEASARLQDAAEPPSPTEAEKLHGELEKASTKLEEIEEKWMKLQEEREALEKVLGG